MKLALPASTSGDLKARVHARRPTGNGAATPTTGTPGLHAASLTQLDALRRQQQRILHRSALIDYVLAAEKRGGEPLTMGDALAELLADITEAARTIGTILQAAGHGRTGLVLFPSLILNPDLCCRDYECAEAVAS